VVVETSECLTCTLPTKSATRLSNPTYYARDSVEDQYIMPVMCFLCCIVMYTLGTKHATAEFKTTAQTAAGSGSGRPSVSLKPQPREDPDSVAKTDVQKPTTPISAAQPSLETVLPPGWVPVRSNTTGAVFWYNKFSRESSWTPPLAAGVSAPKSPAVCFAKADPVAGQVVPTDQALCATMRIVVVRKDTNRIVEAGSGVGVDSRGLVLTACHVVKHAFADPTKYTVLLAPTESVLPGAAAPAMCPVGARSPVWELSARVVAASCNPALDIALLQVVAVVKTEPRSGLFASSDPSPRTKQEMHRSITVSELRGWNCADAAAAEPVTVLPSLPLSCALPARGKPLVLCGYPASGHNTLTDRYTNCCGYDDCSDGESHNVYIKCNGSIDDGFSGAPCIGITQLPGVFAAFQSVEGIASFSTGATNRLVSSYMIMPYLSRARTQCFGDAPVPC
jgi:hypothetical protein